MNTAELACAIRSVLGREMPTRDVRQLLRALFPASRPGRGRPWMLSKRQVDIVLACMKQHRNYEDEVLRRG